MHKWLLLDSSLNHSLRILTDGVFSVMTDFVIAVSKGKRFDLYDVYNPCKHRGGRTNVTFYGTWDDKAGLRVNLTQSKLMRRSNLHGMGLKIGVVVS